MFTRRFVFGRVQSDDNDYVAPSLLYGAGTGYGFVTQENILPAPASNNFVVPDYITDNITACSEDLLGAFTDSVKVCRDIESKEGLLIPLYFRFDVPEYGNYLVKVTLTGEGQTALFENTRQLVFLGELKKGEVREVTFYTNVIPIIDKKLGRFERKCIDITLLGNAARLVSIEAEAAFDVPTLYIAGDSTVTDQEAAVPYAPETSYSGWGQMLSLHLAHRVPVSNHAHSGLTTESFRTEGHYDIVLQNIRKGDFIFFQFGHNDQKLEHLKYDKGYRDNLLRYISEARNIGAKPVIVTPLARNTWNKEEDGSLSYNDLLFFNAEECIKIGKETDTPVIDLHGFMMDLIRQEGKEASKRFFFPGDFTHTNDHGALLVSRFIAEAIGKLNGEYTELAQGVKLCAYSWALREGYNVVSIPRKYDKALQNTSIEQQRPAGDDVKNVEWMRKIDEMNKEEKSKKQ